MIPQEKKILKKIFIQKKVTSDEKGLQASGASSRIVEFVIITCDINL